MSQSTMGSNPLRGDVKRSEQILDVIAGKMGLTEPGKQAIIAAFDPFHDREVNFQGWPDSEGRHSLGQVITLTAQVSAPAGLTAGTTWDCHIIDWPMFGALNGKGQINSYTSNTSSVGAAPNGAFSTSGTTVPVISGTMGGLGIYSFQGGTGAVGPFDNNPLAGQSLTPSASDLKDPWRVVSKGFEVYNTSSELNKQGAVCVYKQPQPNVESAMTTLWANTAAGSGPPDFGYISTLMAPGPPNSASEALRLPSSRQWAAEEGCYVINTLNQSDVPPHIVSYEQPMYYTSLSGQLGGGTYYSYGLGSRSVPLTTPVVAAMFPADNNYTNFDQTGAIFTGLNASSTLTVNYRLFVEVFPSSGSALANFSHPSPECDYAALELFSKLINRAPIGVEVKYNFLGEWFTNGIKSISTAAAPALTALSKAIPDPRLKALAMGANAFKGKEPKKVKKDEKKLVKDEKKLVKDVKKTKTKSVK